MQQENTESNENIRIPCESHENIENLIIATQNHKSYETHRILFQKKKKKKYINNQIKNHTNHEINKTL